MGEADSQKSSLQFVQSGICSHDLVVIAFLAAVVSVHFHVGRYFCIVRYDGAAVPEAAQIFGRIKGKTADVTKCSCPLSVKCRPV